MFTPSPIPLLNIVINGLFFICFRLAAMVLSAAADYVPKVRQPIPPYVRQHTRKPTVDTIIVSGHMYVSRACFLLIFALQNESASCGRCES